LKPFKKLKLNFSGSLAATEKRFSLLQGSILVSAGASAAFFFALLIFGSVAGIPAVSSAQVVSENFANNAQGQHWKQIKSDHFKIIFPARLAPLGQELVPHAEQIFEEYKSRLGTAPGGRISLYLNDDDELVSGLRASDTDPEHSIWKGDPFKKSIKPGERTVAASLRHEIAYVFQESIQYFPIDYWFYLFSRPKQSPWSDGFVSYLAEPAESPYDRSAKRTVTVEDLNNPFWDNWADVLIGRSQIRYFQDGFESDSLQSIYRIRQSLFGLIPYFDFNFAFETTAGMAYDPFQEQWYDWILDQRSEKLIEPEREELGTESTTILEQKNTLTYTGATANYSGQLIANIKYRSNGNEYEQLQIGKTEASEDSGSVISEGYFHPAMDWHPKRNELIFAKQRFNNKQGNYGYRLYSWDAEDGVVQGLTKGQNALLPSFSPDGGHFTYVEKKSAQTIIWLENNQSGSRADVAAFARPMDIGYLDYHPSQEKLLISFYNEGTYKAGILDIESKFFTPLLFEGSFSLDAQWGGDGKRIYFNTEVNGVPNIAGAVVSDTLLSDIQPIAPAYGGALLLDAASDTTGSYLLATRMGISSADKINKISISDERGDADRLNGNDNQTDTASVNESKIETSNDQQQLSLAENSAEKKAQDTESNLRIKPYYTFLNTKWEQPFALPYVAKDGDFGLAGYIELKEPLRTHQFEYYGSVSFSDLLHKSFFYSSYINNSLRSLIELKFNHFPSASGFFGKSRKAETTDVVSLSSLWKLNSLSHDFSNWYAGLTLRYMAFDYFSEASQRLHKPDIFFNNTKTRQSDLIGSLVWRSLKPNRHALIHPPDGEGVRLLIAASRPILGSQTSHARFNLEGYTILPGFGDQRLFLYGNGVVDAGDPAGRDFLSFSDNGDYQLPGPNFLGSVNPGISRFVRGYDSNLVGDRFLFGRAEYRIPFQFNTTEKVLGLLPPARTSLTIFSDGGIMGDARITPDRKTTRYRYSIGAEIKRVFSVGGSFKVTYELGIAQPLNRPLAPQLYFNARSALPF
jgi:hypothetical protein